MSRPLEDWSKDELIATLRELDRERLTAVREVGDAAEWQELRAHQIELEMQNRELREAQALLEESRSRYADLYDLAPVGYCTLDAQGIVREANLEAARLIGVERALLIGRPLTSLVTTDLPRFSAHLGDCLSRRARVSSELTLGLRSGGSLVVQMVSTPLAAGADAVAACMTTLTDVSELKRSEERLRLLSSVSEQLASSLDSRVLPAVVRLLEPELADLAFVDLRDAQGRTERFTSAGSQLIEDFSALPQAEVLAAGEPRVVVGATAHSLRTALGSPAYSGPALAAHAESAGSLLILPISAHGRRLGVFTFARLGCGRVYSAAEQQLAQEVVVRVAMAIDNARLYETARQAILAREDIVAVVSHDLRNPLYGMRLNCDHLLETAPAQDRRSGRKQLEAIQRGIQRMGHMIRDLSELARIEAGHLVLECSAQPLSVVIDEALDLLRPLLLPKRQLLHAPTELPLLTLDCDRGRVLQVLSNVVGNAIKFTPPAGTIHLDVSRDGGSDGRFLRISVRDDGDGIEPGQLEHIFERYWRADQRERKGSGLGLFIAKAIVDAHGGRIGVDSELRCGTIVWFTLPIASQADAPPDASS